MVFKKTAPRRKHVENEYKFVFCNVKSCRKYFLPSGIQYQSGIIVIDFAFL